MIVEVIVSYIAGSVMGFWMFKQMTTERTIAATLDNLVDEGYIRTRVDDEGITQLYKYDENPIEEVLEENDDEEDEPPRGTV